MSHPQAAGAAPGAGALRTSMPDPLATLSSSQGQTDSRNVSTAGSIATMREGARSKPHCHEPLRCCSRQESLLEELHCPQGHELTPVDLDGAAGGASHRCDACGTQHIRRGRLLRCEECDYDLCGSCEVFLRRMHLWLSSCAEAHPAPDAAEGAEFRSETGGLPAVWAADAENPWCQCCAGAFGPFRRKHHCRACGRCVCDGCSPLRAPVPDMGYDQAVRVCRECAELSAEGGFAGGDVSQPVRGAGVERLTSGALRRFAALLGAAGSVSGAPQQQAMLDAAR